MLFGVFIYDGVEPIDLATFGVLSMAKRIRSDIDLCTVAPTIEPVRLSNGLRVLPDYQIEQPPQLGFLIVTGGPGWEAQTRAPDTLSFIRRQASLTPVVSVCTGAMILAASGVLDGKPATTKREVVPPEVPPIERLRSGHPSVATHDALVVDAGNVITGGGVSLCIDTMLHLLGRVFGPEVASETARIIEYERAWAANHERLPVIVASQA